MHENYNTTGYSFCSCNFLYWRNIFLCGFCFAVYHSSVTTWRTPFCISCRADLVVRTTLSFCLSRTVLIFPFLKDSFARYSIPGWNFFLSVFWINHHIPLWPTELRAEKSAETPLIILWKLLCMQCVAFLLLLSRFAVCLWLYIVWL